MSVPLTINLRSVREAELILKACAELDLRDLETREVDAKWDSTAGREISCGECGHTRPDMRVHENPSEIFAIKRLLEHAGVRARPKPKQSQSIFGIPRPEAVVRVNH